MRTLIIHREQNCSSSSSSSSGNVSRRGDSICCTEQRRIADTVSPSTSPYYNTFVPYIANIPTEECGRKGQNLNGMTAECKECRAGRNLHLRILHWLLFWLTVNTASDWDSQSSRLLWQISCSISVGNIGLMPAASRITAADYVLGRICVSVCL